MNPFIPSVPLPTSLATVGLTGHNGQGMGKVRPSEGKDV